tara:strand:- start:58 stop:1893 length:1836 start_codon:yes stop_codon:yes gene_type:complete
MATYGTDNREGVHVEFSMDFNGISDRFTDEIIHVSPLSNSGDTVDTKRKISDLNISLADNTGTIWDEMGHGTGAFNLPVALTVTVGGDYAVSKRVNGTSFGFIGTTGGNQFNLHQGSVVSITKKKNLITIRSENKLNKIKNLKWQMPVRTTSGAAGNNLEDFYGSFAFYNMSAQDSEGMWNGTLTPYCLYNISEDGRSGIFHGHNTDSFVKANFLGTGLYDTSSQGISDYLAEGFTHTDSVFHRNKPVKKFKGTYFGTLFGTLNNDDSAKKHGYSNLDAADTGNQAAIEGDEGTYVLNKIRIEAEADLKPIEDDIYESQLIRMVGDPVAVMNHCLFGEMVSDFLDSSTDTGDTFSASQSSVAFQVYDQIIDPNKLSVGDYIEDAIQMTSAIFFVNTDNKFEFSVYAPQDLSQSLDSIGTNDIIESSFTNNISDYKNRVSLKYGYDFQKNDHSSEVSGTLSNWDTFSDNPLEIKSGWVKSDNQANNFLNKQMIRTKNTSPEINLEMSLKGAGRELGSLIEIEDPDSFEGTKVVQIVGYKKDFGGGRKVSLRCLDGEALYRKRSYGRWTDGILGEAVDTDSKGGWGDAALGGAVGTVNNIGTEFYDGTHFIWW